MRRKENERTVKQIVNNIKGREENTRNEGIRERKKINTTKK